MSDAIMTQGLLLKRGDGATPTEAFTIIAEITDIAGPDESAERIDVTHFGSTAKEFKAALADPGEVTFTCNVVPTDDEQQGLRTDLRAGTVRNFKLILPDDETEANRSTCSFAAIVTGLKGPKGSTNAALTMDVTLKVSGQPSWVWHT